MANTVVLSRAHLIYGLCLPLAIIVGYLLASPFESGSIAVVVLLLSVLVTPILMRWHHPLLIFGCNAMVSFYFLPGTPSLWMAMTAISLFFSVLDRSLGRDLRFLQAPYLSYALLFLALVVFLTAQATGGIGFRSLGGSSFGGKKYVSLFMAIALYFAISTPRTDPKRAVLYVNLFFLSTLTVLMGYFAVLAGPTYYYILVQLFPIQGTLSEVSALGDISGGGISRWGELGGVSAAISCLLLARHGFQGITDLRRPWRLALLLLAFLAAAASGFRSSVIILVLTVGATFWVEGLLRTRYVVGVGLTLLLAAAIAVPNIQRLPLGMQRALAFLPLDVDIEARESAAGSTQWRLDMWQRLLPQVPKYLIKGKGYALSPDDLYMASASDYRGFSSGEGLAVSGDYHSGPLSLIIPFGVFGVIGFVWFVVAGINVLRNNHLYGNPALKRLNAFLYAYFIAKVICFVFIFGSLYSDMMSLSAVLGLNVTINGGVRSKPEELLEEELEEQPA